MSASKPYQLIPIILGVTFLCAGPLALAKPTAIEFSGGDGTSFKQAVVIKGATEETGVHAEYGYLQKHYPGYKRGRQSLQSAKGHAFDVLEFTTADGQQKTIYFDITDFFGK